MQAGPIFIPVLVCSLVALIPEVAHGASPFESKDIAKAKLERQSADMHQLLLARRATARTSCDARLKEFLAGRGTFKFLQNSIWRLLHAELALCASDAERLAAWDETWQLTWLVEQINEERTNAGRIPYKEYMEAQYDRLDTESALIPIRAKAGNLATFASFHAPSNAFFDPSELAEASEPRGIVHYSSWEQVENPSLSKNLARAKSEARRADRNELTRKKLAAARYSFYSREGEFLAGRGTLEFLMETGERLRDAALALSHSDADRLAILESYWVTTRINEAAEQQREEAGRIPVHDLLVSRWFRLKADIDLIMAYANAGSKNIHFPVPDQWIFREHYWENDRWFGFKDIARLLDPTLRGNLKQLSRARRDNAQSVYDARFDEFQNGRGTLDFLIDAALRLLEGELALTDQPAQRIAAIEECWERLMQIEVVNKQRYETGCIPLQDFEESRFHRLDMEIRLARAREKMNPR